MNIVITGASSGIGFEVAFQLAASGHQVFAIARNRVKLEALLKKTKSKNQGASLHVIAGDISRAESIGEITNGIKQKADQIDILINNAGSLINKPFESLTNDDWKSMYDTNVFGTVNLIRATLPFLTEGAHILNISSMGGFQGSAKFKGLSGYSSGKAAIACLTECLAEEFKDRKIAVNCLCLGSVSTEMFALAFPNSQAATGPDDMASFIISFAFDGHRHFNGKILPVSISTP